VDSGSWATYKTVWAEIVDVSGDESFTSDMRVYEDAKIFKIHTHDAPAVTTKMRISYDSKFFLITSINKEGRLRTTLTATAFDDE
jgi:SPP1 family predicted phage head-tail adaptor